MTDQQLKNELAFDVVKRLRRENEKMRGALEHCEGYFDNKADVKDGSYGAPEPNTEMSLLDEVRNALGRSP